MAKISDKYPDANTSGIAMLIRELDSLVSIFDDKQYRLIDLNETNIGICGSINTFAKSKSRLQRIEPVVICIDKADWQTNTPFVFPDRIDFPFKDFPHINYDNSDLPPTLCLTRENIDDWYAEHTLEDYFELVAQWLRDAAIGKLMKLTQNDEFEHQRIHNGDCLLLRASYTDTILEKEREASCHIYSIRTIKDGLKFAYGNEDDTNLDHNSIGIRLFAGSEHINDKWYHVYPNTIAELYAFIQENAYIIDIEHVKSLLDEKKKYVYFQLALLRPAKIIGTNTHINYLCFRANALDILSDNESAIVKEVIIFDFPDFLTAKYLSITPDSIYTKKICILGCGAIGSKIAFHLYRSGIPRITLVDNDTLLPHNIVRHGLTPYNPGSFLADKAQAMSNAMSDIFYGMANCTKAVNEEALQYINKTEETYDIIVDATASVKVMYGIDQIDFAPETKIIRVALSEGGDVGICYVAHDNHQPLADFYMEILRSAISNEQIYRWLSAEKKNSLENIRIGEGCHSNTMRISDDTISAHAALMSSIIRHINEDKRNNEIILSFANTDFHGSMTTHAITVEDYEQFSCSNALNWYIRIPNSLLKQIRIKAKIGGKNETGGYLYGHIDHKRKTIYILNQFTPPDSKGKKTTFRLGTRGVKDYRNNLSKRTINQIEYIGDWHSHPVSSLEMSEKDISTSEHDVLPELRRGIGICVITNAHDTKFYLIANNK